MRAGGERRLSENTGVGLIAPRGDIFHPGVPQMTCLCATRYAFFKR